MSRNLFSFFSGFLNVTTTCHWRNRFWAQDPGHWINFSYLLKHCTVWIRDMISKLNDDFAPDRSAYMPPCTVYLTCHPALPFQSPLLFLLPFPPQMIPSLLTAAAAKISSCSYSWMILLPCTGRYICRVWHYKTVLTFSVLIDNLIWRDRPMSMIRGITKSFFFFLQKTS